MEPKVGIGQQTHVVRTPAGNLLWDPVGYLDDDAVNRVGELGEVTAIAASHPHMFGVQVEWSRALGGVSVLVSKADVEWVQRPDPVIKTVERAVRGRARAYAASSSAVTSPGARSSTGRPVPATRVCCSVSDTIHANPDRETVTFLRSYPNRIPLSPAVVERVTASRHRASRFDRLYDNFGSTIDDRRRRGRAPDRPNATPDGCAAISIS